MGGVFLDRMVSEELTVKQKPKICEGENPAKIYSVSIPGKTTEPDNEVLGQGPASRTNTTVRG